jgi:hypothetical protein
VAEPKLHLDADTSSKALWRALKNRGHDVTRTPNDWMPKQASDKTQLLGATAQGRCIFTFNIRDFMALSKQYPKHAGIILASQASWTLTDLVSALDRMFTETTSEEWVGHIRWLNDWLEVSSG